ncbi:hypothetical protein Bhyg_13386 [Pseudolycoriella hygida]|uniref:Uncharacterized protein n=1 Tax=Pseudolycoriella hygida TaxID=35572 RepID=A0A9Q0MN72_9DIPT|nr:hypothetical protein Bhyg_13386 [Pseudolycoriella hygida]
MFWVLMLLVVLSEYSWSQQLVDYDEDETQPTNINESFDIALEELWPLVIKNGLDKTILPDIAEGFSYRPLFINYNAGVLLRNGMVWNIRKVVRYGDVFMILDKKSLRLGGNVLIDKVDVSVS